ncbi:hypothetical protein [Mycobacterium avium]|uniref:hypothetical protein n=1 Tax=Mycobacterium avium TaxID=1764 RepID=UPI001CC708A3|nr:hypothetical protein [Mycobacterium avium]MBZ4618833.1 hypothetical protein [Mycobacterium avium subsp. hominissuis]
MKIDLNRRNSAGQTPTSYSGVEPRVGERVIAFEPEDGIQLDAVVASLDASRSVAVLNVDWGTAREDVPEGWTAFTDVTTTFKDVTTAFADVATTFTDATTLVLCGHPSAPAELPIWSRLSEPHTAVPSEGSARLDGFDDWYTPRRAAV